MNTLITTYFEEPDWLSLFIENNFDKRFFSKLIVVDDGSSTFPAKDVLSEYSGLDITLFAVPTNIGFNSHGCRNLAMKFCETEWATLLDVDHIIYGFGLEAMQELINTRTDDIWVEFKENQFAVKVNNFWKTGGYNEELINYHCGDNIMQNRLNYLFNKINLVEYCKKTPVFRRDTKKLVFDSNKKITEYPDSETVINPCTEEEMYSLLYKLQTDPFNIEKWKENKVLTFPWIKIEL